MLFGAIVTAIATGLLVRAEHAFPTQRKIWKPLASLGFLIAIAGAELAEPYAQMVGVGLVLSALGDIALLSESKSRFLTGLGLFLAAHIAYIAAFRSLAESPSPLNVVAVTIVFFVVSAWLLPQVPHPLRLPVVAYITTIGVMLAWSFSIGAPLAALGATLFAVSDVAVARNAFGKPALINKLWGLPLYYGGQLLIVASVFRLDG